MDIYQIDAMELWYSIIYPILFLYLPILSLFLLFTLSSGGSGPVPVTLFPTIVPSDIPSPWYEFSVFGVVLVFVFIVALFQIYDNRHEIVSFRSFINLLQSNTLLKIWLVSFSLFRIYYYIVLFTTPEMHNTAYEPFENKLDIAGTFSQVQTVTQSLQSSLDTLSTATDDTCTVIKGIEQKYIDNATAPSGDGDPPSPADAKTIKANLLPSARKKWNQEKTDWAATHGNVPVVECFATGSLQDLVEANRQLSDLLASTPVQRVVSQVKSLQTSGLFAQKYINELATKLIGESFENPVPTPDDTIATSNRLIAKAREIQSAIRGILDSTHTLKNNYVAMNAKANDPNTVTNLAGQKV